jgi:hypothetical protein
LYFVFDFRMRLKYMNAEINLDHVCIMYAIVFCYLHMWYVFMYVRYRHFDAAPG